MTYRYDLQFDYFSENYLQFEKDFYRYSALPIPLTFLEDDILTSMARRQSSIFRLHQSKSLDGRDHDFYFKIHSRPNAPLVRIYRYEGLDLKSLKTKAAPD